MPASRRISAKVSPSTLQDAIDATDVVGHWEWDVPADRLYADALVALLFNVDPDQAEAGAPVSAFVSGVHPKDREWLVPLNARHVRQASSYLAEYRVCSADGRVRWVLSRGRFQMDPEGQPFRGRGIIIDITRNRAGEDADQDTCAEPPLEQAADSFIAGRRALEAVEGQPVLRQLADILLLEVGRVLAAQARRSRRRRMN